MKFASLLLAVVLVQAASAQTQCSPLHYLDNGDCKKCQDGMITAPSGTSCTACAAGEATDAVNNVCVKCAAGYECPSKTDAREKLCPTGQTSELGSSSCTPCPAGYACWQADTCSNTPVSTTMRRCRIGTYSPGGQATCSQCPANHACPSKTTAEPCPAGTFAILGSSVCNRIPIGHIMDPTTNGSLTMCSSGTHPDAAGTNCVGCPRGAACPNGYKIPCVNGKYQDQLGSTTCLECPPGHKCETGKDKVECDLGRYSPGGNAGCLLCSGGYFTDNKGSTSCRPCEAGFECPAGGDKLGCAKGFAATSGSASCRPCREGFYAPNTEMGSCLACPAGHFCADTVSEPIACTTGSYSPGQAASCTPCPGNTTCSSTGVVACARGEYVDVGVCRPCEPMFKCPDPSQPPVPCSQGQYSYPGAIACLDCPVGSMCTWPPNADRPHVVSCLLGQYQTVPGGNCTNCPAGSYCTSPTEPARPCVAGTYAASGQPFCTTCPPGRKCPAGSAEPVDCGAGTFGRPGSSECSDCAAGFYCPPQAADQVPCAVGYYSGGKATSCSKCPKGSQCPSASGTPIACEQGTFSYGGQATCTPCPVGFKCTDPATGAHEACPPGSYSGQGQNICTPCPAGQTCRVNSTGVVTTPCEPGSFSAAGGSRCETCPAGFKCPGATDKQSCSGGTFSTEGSTDCTECPPYHMCGAEAGAATRCDAGTMPDSGKAACVPCVAGKVCKSNNVSTCATSEFTANAAGAFVATGGVQCITCPAGFQCGNNQPTRCAAGTFAPGGASSCTPCPANHICEESASEPVTCPSGKKADGLTCLDCEQGKQCTPGVAPVACPKGLYCPGGKAEICPSGTHTINTGSTAATACVECAAGNFCAPGEESQSCPAGNFCPAKTSVPVPCPGGTYSTGAGKIDSSSCIVCERGNFCPAGSSSQQTCPKGAYCPGKTAAAIPCPIGTFGASAGATCPSQCVQCPEGHFCALPGRTEAAPCKKGFYAPAPGMSYCKACPAGFVCQAAGLAEFSGVPCPVDSYCPVGNAKPIHCPAGTHGQQTHKKSSGDCQVCTEGQYCPGLEGQSASQPCPQGRFCPGAPVGKAISLRKFTGDVTTIPQYCPGGTYGTQEGQIDATGCTPCSAGKHCPPGSTSNDAACAVGHYCPAGGAPVKCPAGKFNNEKGKSQLSDCTTCPKGQFCREGSAMPVDCPVGTHSANKGAPECVECPAGAACDTPKTIMAEPCLAGSYAVQPGGKSCTPCEAGRACEGAGTVQPVECPKGKFCAFGKAPAPCPAGHYCLAGAELPTKCAIGTAFDGAGRSDPCPPCPAGGYCSERGLPAPNGKCDPGFYCEAGSTSPQSFMCPPGHSSHQGAAAADQCTPCEAGFYCSPASVAPVMCPAGHFCPPETAIPQGCPPSTIRATEGAKLQSDCAKCPSGHYCDAYAQTQPTGKCFAGYYCQQGEETPIPPQGLCPVGHWCPAGEAPIPCEAGTFNDREGASNVSACQPCRGGYYCDGPGNANITTKLCRPGFFCAPGSTKSDNEVVPSGHYSGPGAYAPWACPPGSFNDQVGQEECLNCTVGGYCDRNNMTAPIPCEIGRYCPSGSIIGLPCPIGTYGAITGAHAVSSCQPCDGGKYCPRLAQESAANNCSAGYYCPSGCASDSCSQYILNGETVYRSKNFSSDEYKAPQETGGICPYGHYCPVGSAWPQVCPAGTLQIRVGAKNADECRPCPGGQYCPKTGMTDHADTEPCKAGFYCPGPQRCTEETCGNLFCPVGHACPAGSSFARPCYDNSNATHRESCDLDCQSGMDCTTGNITACPKGHYCPGGIPRQCPPKTYNPVEGAKTKESCLLCTDKAGCPGFANVAPIPCRAGYLCPNRGSDSIMQVTCPVGMYCPPGSSNGTNCPVGRYQSTVTIAQRVGTFIGTPDDCNPCDAGHYCDSEGLSAPTGKCKGGYYCSGMAEHAEQHDCSTGHFCPNGTLEPQRCKEGYFVPQTVTHAVTCQECPPGFKCKFEEQGAATNYQFDYTVPIACPSGQWCEGGPDVFECPAGTLGNLTGGKTKDEACFPCTPGQYCAVEGATKPTGPCFAGFQCKHSSRPDPDGSNKALEGGLCPIGNYCPMGTVDPTGCQQGTYRDNEGAKTTDECFPCTAGFYCSAVGLDGVTGPCTSGTYCPVANDSFVGWTTANGIKCPKHHYCPEGSAHPLPCPADFEAPVEGAAECTRCKSGTLCRCEGDDCICPAGKVCPGGECLLGSYLVDPTRTGQSQDDCVPCTAGRFCTSSEVKGQCAAGHFCNSGNYLPTPNVDEDIGQAKNGTTIQGVDGDLCPQGMYCPAGAVRPIPCPTGTYGAGRGLKQAADCKKCKPGNVCDVNGMKPCPVGNYCPDGSPIPCPKGTYNPVTGATNLGFCLPCANCHYCPLKGMSNGSSYPAGPGTWSGIGQAFAHTCAGGTYHDKTGSFNCGPNVCEECPEYHFCPAGSTTPVNCPEFLWCPAGSPRPLHCPAGHYCPPGQPPQQCSKHPGYTCDPTGLKPCPPGHWCPGDGNAYPCPQGWEAINTTASERTSLLAACRKCKPGTYSTDSKKCKPCPAGYTCPDGDLDPKNVCPPGHYCPPGSKDPIQCPAGTFRQKPGGASETDCHVCPPKEYSNDPGSIACKSCNAFANANDEHTGCVCIGKGRIFQPGDGSCRCMGGTHAYESGRATTDGNGKSDCQPLVYTRCGPDQARVSTGGCSPVETECTAQCPNGGGTLNTILGICECNTVEDAQVVCDDECQKKSNVVTIEGEKIIVTNPVTKEKTSAPVSSMLNGDGVKCDSATCVVKMVSFDGDNNEPSGVFNVSADELVSLNDTTGRRRRAESGGVDEKKISKPIVCLNNGETMMWRVDHQHYPVYNKDNLLNTNPQFDYTAFRVLADKLKDPNQDIPLFGNTFSDSGTYVFHDAANPNAMTIITVMAKTEQCTGDSFAAMTGTTLSRAGVDRDDAIILEPDWILVGVLLAGFVLVVGGTVIGLWHFRRQTWGLVGNALPKYRNLGMELLGGRAAGLSSKGSHLRKVQVLATGEERLPIPPGSSRPITLRLDTPLRGFDPSEFVAIVAEEAGVGIDSVMVLSVTEGSTIVRFVITDVENPQEVANLLINRIADETSDIHAKLPILAFDSTAESAAALDANAFPANRMGALEDDFWDYERQIDLEGFNVRTLYDKLEDQTIHVVSQLANQRDDVLLLCDKILVESEALKDMFVKVKLDIDERNQAEKDLIEKRDLKMASGQVEFDLPEDLKAVLTHWLNDFFSKNLGDLFKNAPPGSNAGGPFSNAGGASGKESRTGRAQVSFVDDADAEAVTADEADTKDMKGFGDMFSKEDGKGERGGQVAGRSAGAKRRGGHPVDFSEFPAELRDDSDLDDADRLERAEARARHMSKKLGRARRMMDRVVMPPGLEDIGVVKGVRTAEEAEAVKKDHEAWVVKARELRTEAEDGVPENLKDNAALPVPERMKLADKRAQFAADKLRQLRTAAGAVTVPASLTDDTSLPEQERAARAEKRAKYLTQKIAKARRAKFEALAPPEVATDSDVSDGERRKRHEQQDDFVSAKLSENPYVSVLPDPEEPGLTEATMMARKAAIQQGILNRATMASRIADELDLPDGLSDNSDLSPSERDRREAQRNDLLQRGPLRSSKHKAKPSGAVSPGPHHYALKQTDMAGRDPAAAAAAGVGLGGIPDDIKDDSDLDDDERKERKAQRQAFRKGKDAAPDAPMPFNELEAPTLEEKARRGKLNEAFRRGLASRLGADPKLMQKLAEDVRASEQTAQRDAATKALFEQGKAAAAASAMPAEFEGAGEDKLRMRRAFKAGCRAESVAQRPPNLASGDLAAWEEGTKAAAAAEVVPQRFADDDAAAAGYRYGRDAEKAKAFAELVEAEDALGNHDHARALAAVFNRGAAAATLVAVPEEIEDDRAAREAFQAGVAGVEASSAVQSNPRLHAAFLKGRERRGMVEEAVEDLRDDLPLLGPEEVRRRRVLRAAFEQGLAGAVGKMRLAEMEADGAVPEVEKKAAREAFEAGHKAQKAADAVPAELQTSEEAKAAFIQGRSAKHMAEAFIGEQLEAGSKKDRVAGAAALRKGRAAQKAFDALPEDLADDLGMEAPAREDRRKKREAFHAGRLAAAARTWKKDAANRDDFSEGAVELKIQEKKARSMSDSAAVGDNGEARSAAASATVEKEMKMLDRDFARKSKALKEREAADLKNTLGELEQETKAEATEMLEFVADQFGTQRRKLKQKREIALMAAPADRHAGIKAEFDRNAGAIDEAEAAAVAETQERLRKAAEERKAKAEQQVKAKALNERRLEFTLKEQKKKEAERLAEPLEEMESLPKEERMQRHRGALLERIKGREKRLKAKVNKEREFMETEMANKEKAATEVVERKIVERQVVMQAAVQQSNMDQSEIQSALAKITEEVARMREHSVAEMQAELKRDRMEQERMMAEKHAAEKAQVMKDAQAEVDRLLQTERDEMQKQQAAATEAARKEAEDAMRMLMEQQRQREELQRQLERDHAQQQKELERRAVQAEAQKEITRREEQLGEKLSDNQKQAILDECAKAAATMQSATGAEHQRQVDQSKRVLEAKRRKREGALQKKQMGEMQEELRRQEAAERERQDNAKEAQAAAAAAQAAAAAAAATKPKDEVRLEAQMEERAQQEVKDVETRHEMERQQADQKLEAEVKKIEKKEEIKLHEQQQRKLQELQSEQQAKESMSSLKEDEKKKMIDAHREEARQLQQQLDAEADAQRARVKAKLEQKRRAKQQELAKRQVAEKKAATDAQEDEARKSAMVKEKQVIEAAVEKMKKAGKDEAEGRADVAVAVMAQRHAEERAKLQARHREEKEKFEQDAAAARDAKEQAVRAEVAAELAKLMAEAEGDEEKIAAAKAACDTRLAEELAAVPEELEKEKDDKQLEHMEEMMTLRAQQNTEINQACGIEDSLDDYKAKMEKRGKQQKDDAMQSLKALKGQYEKEQREMKERMEREQAEYEAKMRTEAEERQKRIEEQFKEKEASRMREMEEAQKKRMETLLQAQGATAATPQAEEIKRKLLEDTEKEKAELHKKLEADKKRQQQQQMEALKRKRAAAQKKKEAALASVMASSTASRPTSAGGDAAAASSATPATAAAATGNMHPAALQNVLDEAARGAPTDGAAAPSFTLVPSDGAAGAAAGGQLVPASGAALDQWVGSVVSQLHNSPLMQKVARIERMVEDQVRHGLLSYYVDDKDLATKNEGRLKEVEAAALPTAKFVPFFYGKQLLDHIRRLGVSLPQVELRVASSLPEAQSVMNAFRHSYYYDANSRALFVRDSRLATLGEASLVVLHAMAHIKTGLPPMAWNDAAPHFLREFYGLMECSTEELFFMRMPKGAAVSRDAADMKRGEQYRPQAIMSRESLGDVDKALQGVPPNGREAALKAFLGL